MPPPVVCPLLPLSSLVLWLLCLSFLRSRCSLASASASVLVSDGPHHLRVGSGVGVRRPKSSVSRAREGVGGVVSMGRLVSSLVCLLQQRGEERNEENKKV
jgi:hypothetical protein